MPTARDEPGPPDDVRYHLAEALALLAALEDGRDALIETDHFADVVSVESEIRLLSRKLGFIDPERNFHAG